jgi:acyl-CoA hydrolase
VRIYNSIHLVKGEDLNHHGTLFAARTAAWYVESAFVAAAASNKNSSEIVCRNIHGMSFGVPVEKGDVVCFSSRVARVGRTSITVHVSVRSELTGVEQVSGFVTFVTVDEEGRKKPHGIALDESEDDMERQIRELADKLFEK